MICCVFFLINLKKSSGFVIWMCITFFPFSCVKTLLLCSQNVYYYHIISILLFWNFHWLQSFQYPLLTNGNLFMICNIISKIKQLFGHFENNQSLWIKFVQQKYWCGKSIASNQIYNRIDFFLYLFCFFFVGNNWCVIE